MKNLLKIAMIAFCITLHQDSKAMYGPRNDDYVGPVLNGMVAGWAYERLLYRLPILLGLPTAAVAGFVHLLSMSGYSNNQTNVVAMATLATGVSLYLCEKPDQKEIVIVHQPYPVYEAREHHHHHGHHHHN